MRSDSKIPTQARLKELLDYDPETGLFTWRVRRGRAEIGSIAGTLNSEGYRRIQVDGVLHCGSRLVWLYMTGEWPELQMSHRNRKPGDDRFRNLRNATQTQNKANSGVYKNNRLGVKGVRRHRNGQYEARLRVHGKLQYLGCFWSIREAKAVYDAAAQEAFGEFAASA